APRTERSGAPAAAIARKTKEGRRNEMTKWIASAVAICAGKVVILAQAPTVPKPAAPTKTVAPSAPSAASGASAVDAKTSRAFVNRYCVTCHNTKTPQPASHPIDLEKANLDNVLADAET